MDEADLDDKYKNKPEQLANIKATARTLWHPDRKVWMYEDRELSIQVSKSSEYRETKKRICEAEYVVKPGKKAKTLKDKPAKAAGEVDDGSEGDKLIVPKPPFIKKLQKATRAEVHGKLQTKLATQMATIKSHEYKGLIPEFQVKKLEDAEKSMEEFAELAQKVLTNNNMTAKEKEGLEEHLLSPKSWKEISEKMAGETL